MNTIGIITNPEKDIGLINTTILAREILKKGGKVRLVQEIAEKIGMESGTASEEQVIREAEAVLCLGGDGTFLKAARKAQLENKPMLGINLGTLGFLTEVEKSEIGTVVDRILADAFEIEDRMMLQATVTSGGRVIATDLALNDVVISRGALSRILHLKTYTNDVFVDSFPGDGLIISSPTGSTAYSLSAGGPIVEPDIDLIIVTPICPHILYSRAFITAGDRVVKVVVDENYSHEAMVTIDGQQGYEIRGGDSIEIRKAEQSVRMIKMNKRNFFNILRNKIYDRGECFRKDEI